MSFAEAAHKAAQWGQIPPTKSVRSAISVAKASALDRGWEGLSEEAKRALLLSAFSSQVKRKASR